MAHPTPSAVEAALREFIGCIENTGGVTISATGLAEPLGDPEWIDLGEAYLKACAALHLPPVQQAGPFEAQGGSA